MMVRAKFFVEDIRHNDVPGTDQYATITMKPVFGTYADGDVEGTNKSWSKWTPSGQLSITITNPDAIDAFEKGKAYYLDFTPVAAEG
ncbi:MULTISPECIES: hypothetical protein [unclassified Bradyrhizobium]|uniref:hypothetical protein n=1 Tax=unclassified Bradyrhizobium TaxID=2631580 RepID=UPI0029169237|nr:MULTISPECIES: hypothetical protein [unclassified Bradyrhizobium]